jgi:hypothetical protein
MRIYRCKILYFGEWTNEEPPDYPRDYHEPEEFVQQGTGDEALESAFRQCHAEGRDMEPGDVVGLDDGRLFRCEASGWTDIGKMWTARVRSNRERTR